VFERGGSSVEDFCGVCGGDNVANECDEEADCYASGGFFVSMSDAYGDGWNGNVLTIGDASFTIDSGASAEGCYTGGSDVAVTCGGGSWGSEVSWTISDADGVVLSGGAPFDGCLGTCDDGGADCTDYDINMYDAYGDGWNGNTATIVDGENSFSTGLSNGSEGSASFSIPIPDPPPPPENDTCEGATPMGDSGEGGGGGSGIGILKLALPSDPFDKPVENEFSPSTIVAVLPFQPSP
jgi:hypothetical protein